MNSESRNGAGTQRVPFVDRSGGYPARSGRPLPAALVLLALAAAMFLPCRSGGAAEEAELRKPILAFLAGLEARSLDAAMAPWAGKSPYLAAQRTSLTAQFKASSEIHVKNVKWVRSSQDAQGAAVRVTYDLETQPEAGGKPAADALGQRRTFQLVSELGEWRIWRNVGSERFLAEALVKSGAPEAREALLRQDADLQSPVLIQQLRLVIGELNASRPLESQLAHYAAALNLAERVGDRKETARLIAARGVLLLQKAQYTGAETDFRRALTLLQESGDTQGVAVTQFNLAMVYVGQVRYKDALPLFEASADGAAAGGATQREAQARYWIGYSLHSLLDHAGALTAYQSSAGLFSKAKDGPGEARALRAVGDVLKVLRRDAEALPAWERSADLYRDAGMRREETEVLYDVGLTYGVLGNYARAYQAQSRRVKVAAALGDSRILADSVSAIALTLGVLGQSAEEASFLESELVLRRRINDVSGEAKALRALGDAYRDLSRFGAAGESYEKSLGLARQIKDREMEGEALAAQARLLGELGDYLRASEAGEQAVRIFRELKLPSREADAVRELGKQYRAQGRHAEALAQFDASLALDKQAEDLLGAARDLDEAAQDHLLTGRFREALALYDTTLKLYQAAKLRLGEADVYNKQGAALKSLGRYTEAEAAFQKSFELSRELGLETGEQQARANLAGLYTTTGRYPEALAGYTESLAAFRKLGARSAEATVLTNLAKLYAGKGEFQRAEEHHQLALTIYRELKDARGIAEELHNLADVNADRARFGEALTGFTEALKAFRTAGLRLAEANTLAEQASVYRQLGKPAEALALYEEARRIRSEIGDRSGLARGEASVAAIHLREGKLPEALKAYRSALATVRALGEKPSEPALLNNLGLVLRSMGRFGESRKCLQEALEASRALGERAGEAGTLGNIAFLLQLEGKPADAERTYREALKLGEEQNLPDVTFRCWFGLGLLHRSQKQWRTAARELGKATGLIERIRGDVREQSLQTSFLEQFVSPYHQEADCLIAAGEPAAAFMAGERAKARALVDVLRNGKAPVTKAMTPAERETEAKLDGRLTALNAEMREARFLPTDQLLARETELTETRGALEQFRRQLFLAHPSLQAQRGSFAAPTLTQLNRTLFAREPGLCVISYLAGFNETLVFAVSRGKSPTGPAALSVYRVPLTRKLLEERVQTFWGECSQPGGQYQKPGQQLYRDLIQPAAKDLAGKTHLVLVPDGPLHTLPFQALQDARGKHLVEQVALSYAPSVSALVAMGELGDRRRAQQPESDAIPMLAFGRPKMDAGLSDLPATEAEVRTISRLFGTGAELVTGADASEERFKAAAVRARCLHLATHGLVNESAPMYSALALAHGPGEDGRLEARELLDLDLRAHLVVLSACETALGKIVGGEGVRGLTWALFVAGAPSTVVSHWQVEDETTGVLMAAFYRRMLPPPANAGTGKPPVAALSKAQALRAAQLAVMRDGKHAHPYFWAPFILVGDGRGGIAAPVKAKPRTPVAPSPMRKSPT